MSQPLTPYKGAGPSCCVLSSCHDVAQGGQLPCLGLALEGTALLEGSGIFRGWDLAGGSVRGRAGPCLPWNWLLRTPNVAIVEEVCLEAAGPWAEELSTLEEE